MQKRISRIGALLSLLLPLGAAEYFVAPSGSDSFPGSAEKPFKTIKKAAGIVNQGDIVTVRGGTYREQVSLRRSGTKEAPITFRGAPGETALLTAAFPFEKEWKKSEGRRFVWENHSPHSIHMLWEKRRGSRYLPVDSLELLDRQPGAFLFDRKDGKVYVHTLEGRDPNAVGMMLVPWYGGKANAGFSGGTTGEVPLRYDVDPTGIYPWNKGFIVYGSHIILENFQVDYLPGQAIRVNSPAKHCVVRNNSVRGGTCGIMLYGPVEHSRVEGNRVSHVAGTGIQLAGAIKDCTVENNRLFNNGSCPPFTGEQNGSSGNIFSMAYYGGGAERVNFKNNLVVGDDPDRRTHNHLMRCKGGIGDHSEQTGNVFLGAGVHLYAVSKSTANVANNTCVDGKYSVGELSTGESYAPVFKDNLFITDRKTDPKFADAAHYDFRLRPDSPHIGKGAHPEAGNVLYVKPGASGDGSTPEKPLPSIAAALAQADAKKPCTLYLAPGVYTGSATADGTVSLLDYGKNGEAILDGATLAGKGKFFADGIVFRNSTLRLNDHAGFSRCFFENSRIDGNILVLLNTTLTGGTVGGRSAIIRDCLFYGKETPLDVRQLISENNVFTSEAKLEAHTQKYKESHPSFAAAVKPDAEGRLPRNHPLAYAGLNAEAIGGRPAAEAKVPFTVEHLKATPILPDRALVEWETPFHYADVSLRGTGLKTHLFRQGLYRSTFGSHCFKDLKPGTAYKVQLYFYLPGARTPIKKEVGFTTPQTTEHTPKTLRVEKGKAGACDTLREAVAAARTGDTIVVAPGIYTEQIRIDVDGITLKSEIPGKASLDAARLFDYSLFLNGVKNVTVDGFRFTGLRYSASSKALTADDVKNLTVRNCLFDRNRQGVRCSNIQLFVNNADGLTVENCVFDSGFHGIWSFPTKNAIIRNNTFWGLGINGIHLGCDMGDKVEIYNNLLVDTVSNHQSPAVTVADHGAHVTCDYNLYWKTKLAPKQCYYSFGRHKPGHSYSAPWSVKTKNLTYSLEETQKRYGVEKHGLEADPKFVDALNGDFSLKPDSPALKRGKDGKNIGADFSVFR